MGQTVCFNGLDAFCSKDEICGINILQEGSVGIFFKTHSLYTM